MCTHPLQLGASVPDLFGVYTGNRAFAPERKEWVVNNERRLVGGLPVLAGGYCLHALIDDPLYSEVIALVRKPLLESHPQLKTVITKFDNLKHDLSRIQADDIYCCLGTTIKRAGSQEAFRTVDFLWLLRQLS